MSEPSLCADGAFNCFQVLNVPAVLSLHSRKFPQLHGLIVSIAGLPCFKTCGRVVTPLVTIERLHMYGILANKLELSPCHVINTRINAFCQALINRFSNVLCLQPLKTYYSWLFYLGISIPQLEPHKN